VYPAPYLSLQSLPTTDRFHVIGRQLMLACTLDDKPLVPGIGSERRINVAVLGGVYEHRVAIALSVNDQSHLVRCSRAQGLRTHLGQVSPRGLFRKQHPTRCPQLLP
jgi:hypothetical protein